MGTIKNGKKWSGVRIAGIKCNGAVKNGNVFWKTFYIFAGITNEVFTTGTELRNALSEFPILDNEPEFIINADGEKKTIVFALPQEKELKSVKSSEGETLYSDLNSSESNIKINNTITSMPDDNGTDRPYKIYSMTTAIAYSIGIKITVKIV